MWERIVLDILIVFNIVVAVINMRLSKRNYWMSAQNLADARTNELFAKKNADMCRKLQECELQMLGLVNEELKKDLNGH